MSRVKVNLPDKLDEFIENIQHYLKMETDRHFSKEKVILMILNLRQTPYYVPLHSILQAAKNHLEITKPHHNEAEATE